MTAKEFGILADAIKTYFPRDNVLPTEKALRLWYEELKDIPYQIAHTALRKYVSTNKFAPTIADIREQSTTLALQAGNIDVFSSDSQAWQIVWKAIRCSGDYDRAEDNFDKFPPAVQRAVGSPKQLQEWALTQNLNVEVVSSNFRRTYRTEQQREREKYMLSPDLLKIITSGSLKIENNKKKEGERNE